MVEGTVSLSSCRWVEMHASMVPRYECGILGQLWCMNHVSPLNGPLSAGISSSPTIIDGSGDTSGATLRVLRPDDMSDDAVATYLMQAYSDADAAAKVSGRGPSLCTKQHCSTHVRRWPLHGRLWHQLSVHPDRPQD